MGPGFVKRFWKSFLQNRRKFFYKVDLVPFYKAVKRPQFRHSVGFSGAVGVQQGAQGRRVKKAFGHRAGKFGPHPLVIFVLAQPVRQRAPGTRA